jgi:iron(III) transport system permease protein
VTTHQSTVAPREADVASRGRPRRTRLSQARSRIRQFVTDPRSVLLIVTTVVVAYMTLVPVGTLLISGFRSDFLGFGESHWTLQNFADTFTSEDFLSTLWESVEYSLLVTIVATIVGFALAWLYCRTNTPAKWFALLVSLVPLILPGLMSAAAWILLLAPHTGPVNIVLESLGLPQVPVFSMGSMVFVQSMHAVPISFLMGMSLMSGMDRSLEEAAAASGAGPARVFRSVALPMMRPGLLGAALLIFVLTISSFEVPQLIGVPGHHWVLTTKIFNATNQQPADYGTVGVLGVVVLVIALLGLYLSRRAGGGEGRARETITGKGFRPSTVDLGRWKWVGLLAIVLYGFVGVILPVLTMVWASFLPTYENPSSHAFQRLGLANYRQIFDSPDLLSSLEHTFVVAAVTAVVTTLLCAVIGYLLVKTKLPGRGILEMLATAPVALPSVILGVSLLYWYLAAPLPIHLYGTLALLIIAFITSAMPFGLRFMEPGIAQISTELDEAARNSGASGLQTFFRIYLPLLRPALTASVLFCFIIAFKELTAALFLYSPQSQVIAVSMYSLWLYGSYTTVCAVGVLMLIVLTLAVVLVRIVSSHGGIRQQVSGVAIAVPGPGGAVGGGPSR